MKWSEGEQVGRLRKVHTEGLGGAVLGTVRCLP